MEEMLPIASNGVIPAAFAYWPSGMVDAGESLHIDDSIQEAHLHEMSW